MSITYEFIELDNNNEKQLAELVELYEEIFEVKIDRKSIVKTIQGIYEKALWLVAKNDDKIIGFVTRATYDEKSNHMYNLGVKKEFRKREIGKKLFELIQEKDKQMFWFVERNNVPLLFMYFKWGGDMVEYGEKYIKYQLKNKNINNIYNG